MLLIMIAALTASQGSGKKLTGPSTTKITATPAATAAAAQCAGGQRSRLIASNPQHRAQFLEKQLEALSNTVRGPLRIVELHLHDSKNIGDVYCSPFEHFALLRRLRTISLDVRERDTVATIKSLTDNRTLFIIGGGGLVTPGGGGFSLCAHTACKYARCIIWSVGTNSRSYDLRSAANNVGRLGSDYKSISHNRKPLQPLPGVMLAAGRDFGVPLPVPWTPLMDASSMLPLSYCARTDASINLSPQGTPLVSYYLHSSWFTQYLDWGNATDLVGPRLLNSETSIDAVLGFLCKAEVVVTTSYHGAYWAALMGKRIVAVNTAQNSKLLFFPFSIEILQMKRGRAATASQLRAAIRRARELPPTVLAMERRRTWEFYERVLLVILNLTLDRAS